MSKRVKVEGKIITVPDDATPDEIDQISKGSATATPTQNAADTGVGIRPQPSLFSAPGIKSMFYTLADKATNLLPSIGGAGGGLLGAGAGSVAGPVGTVGGGVGGAAIGGAGGEAARQLARRALGFEVPKTSMDAAESIGGEGLRQGAYEAGGQVIGRVGRVVSPKLAEAAVAPGKRMLKSIPEGVDIGRTILDESKGFSPKAITKELTAKIGNTSDEVDRLAGSAHLPGAYVSLDPARKIVADEMSAAVSKNSPSYIRDVGKVNQQLTHQFGPNGKTPIALPTMVDPVRARSLKQGVGLEIGNWNPEAQAAVAPLQERVYGALNEGFHNSVPGAAELDKKMTSLSPARDAAWNTSFNPGITRSVMDRIARPTGALVGSAVGAEEGYRHGGVGGAVVGGVGGLVVPHLITSPVGMITAARALEHEIPAKALRYTIPLAESQRKRPEDTE